MEHRIRKCEKTQERSEPFENNLSNLSLGIFPAWTLAYF